MKAFTFVTLLLLWVTTDCDASRSVSFEPKRRLLRGFQEGLHKAPSALKSLFKRHKLPEPQISGEVELEPKPEGNLFYDDIRGDLDRNRKHLNTEAALICLEIKRHHDRFDLNRERFYQWVQSILSSKKKILDPQCKAKPLEVLNEMQADQEQELESLKGDYIAAQTNRPDDDFIGNLLVTLAKDKVLSGRKKLEDLKTCIKLFQ